MTKKKTGAPRKRKNYSIDYDLANAMAVTAVQLSTELDTGTIARQDVLDVLVHLLLNNKTVYNLAKKELEARL